jgi:hypothetical protein
MLLLAEVVVVDVDDFVVVDEYSAQLHLIDCTKKMKSNMCNTKKNTRLCGG